MTRLELTDDDARGESGTTAGARARKHHGNRHGRSEQARLAVLRATDDLLVERGFAGVTIEGIAARAGVAKQTIYRQWNSKVDILLDTYLADAERELAVPDRGSVEQDLREYLRRLTGFLTTSDAGAVLRALIGQAQHDPELAHTLRTDHLAQQWEWERAILRRAVDRGELPADLDLDLALDQLTGPVYFRVLVTGRPVEQRFTDTLLERFLADYRTHST
ncbi:TetR/AcrR family transcriptional regulator [Kitasatospora sp. NPDC089509]|uniref:TetR/AcrR family transcriptional regulator n=1 Tax=Kitasatospora sp. NPDC089509 TaxID=3364079 RepID=UPI0038075DE6